MSSVTKHLVTSRMNTTRHVQNGATMALYRLRARCVAFQERLCSPRSVTRSRLLSSRREVYEQAATNIRLHSEETTGRARTVINRTERRAGGRARMPTPASITASVTGVWHRFHCDNISIWHCSVRSAYAPAASSLPCDNSNISAPIQSELSVGFVYGFTHIRLKHVDG